MSHITSNKFYAVVHKATLKCGLLNFGFSCVNPESEPEPSVDDDNLVVLLDAETLGELSPEAFLAAKKPVLLDGVFQSWEDRLALVDLTLEVSGAATDDLTDFATVALYDGPPGGSYQVIFSRPVSTNLTNGAGEFNGAGASSFKVKAYGAGDITVTVQVEGYRDATGVIPVTPGSF